MSIRHPDGSVAEHPVASNPEAFVLALYREWTKGDPARVRRLAALTLHANGWTMEMIAQAMGWMARGHAARVVNKVKAEIAEHFERQNRRFQPV